MKDTQEYASLVDPQVVAALISRHYSNRTVTKTLPGCPQEVTETTTEWEPYTVFKYVPPEGFWALLALSYRKVMFGIRLVTLWIWRVLAACIHEAAHLLKCVVICRGKGACFANPRRHKSVKRSTRQLLCYARWIWRHLCRSMRERIADRYRQEVVRHREVERTVTREVEGPPVVVEESIPGKNRLLAVGRGRLQFQGHQTHRGVIVTGPPSLMEPRSIRYPALADAASPFQKSSEMEAALEHVPWVLDGETNAFDVPAVADSYYSMGTFPMRGLEKDIMGHFHEMAGYFRARRDLLLEFAAVTDPELLDALAPAASDGIPELPEEIESLEHIVASQGGTDLEKLAEQWPVRWRHVTEVLHLARDFSLRELVAAECMDLGTVIGYSAFNFYCPQCNDTKRKTLLARDYSVQSNQDSDPVTFSPNSRCLFDPDEDVWRCVTCEFETPKPIPMHRMLDEILLPAYDHLMNENKVERVRAHQGIRNKEIENRNSLETELQRTQIEYHSQIDVLGEELERLRVDVSGELVAIRAMEDILRAYEIKQTAVMTDIRTSSAKTDREIRERTAIVVARMNEVKQQEMESLDAEMQLLSGAKRKEDEERDAVQRAILATGEQQLRESEKQTQVAEATLEEEQRQTGVQRDVLRESERQTGVQRDALRESRKHTQGQQRLDKRIKDGNAISYAHAQGKRPSGRLNPHKSPLQKLWWGEFS